MLFNFYSFCYNSYIFSIRVLLLDCLNSTHQNKGRFWSGIVIAPPPNWAMFCYFVSLIPEYISLYLGFYLYYLYQYWSWRLGWDWVGIRLGLHQMPNCFHSHLWLNPSKSSLLYYILVAILAIAIMINSYRSYCYHCGMHTDFFP